jgi:hypothetical protein
MVAVLAPLPAAPSNFVPVAPAPHRFVPRSVPSAGERSGSARRHAPEVYRRRRVVALGALVLVFGGAGLLIRGWLSGPPDAAGPSLAGRTVAAHVWVVRPGDTLWAIALASGDKGDIRPLVDELSAQVHGQPLQIGQRILLP